MANIPIEEYNELRDMRDNLRDMENNLKGKYNKKEEEIVEEIKDG